LSLRIGNPFVCTSLPYARINVINSTQLNLIYTVTKDHMKWRKSLQPSNYEDYRDDLLQKRHENTCAWLLDDESFKLWNEQLQDNRTVLWINGGPGCGKSVLSAFLSKQFSRGEASQISVAYFFCDDKDERLRTASAVLANWLAQLLYQVPNLIVHFSACADSMEKEKTRWTFGMLWRVFQRIIEDVNAGSICLLVDALGMSPWIDSKVSELT
jgi:hypothetical protein